MPLAVVLRALLDLGMNLLAVRSSWRVERDLAAPGVARAAPADPGARALALAVALLTSALYVRLRDIDQLWGMLAQILFFASPILYVVSAVPANLRRTMMFLNPLAAIFTQMRHALVDASAPTAAAAAGGAARLLVPAASRSRC